MNPDGRLANAFSAIAPHRRRVTRRNWRVHFQLASGRHSDRYLEKFEGLLTQASRSDPANLLSSAFVTSDVGKVYVLLSRAIGRMN